MQAVNPFSSTPIFSGAIILMALRNTSRHDVVAAENSFLLKPVDQHAKFVAQSVPRKKLEVIQPQADSLPRNPVRPERAAGKEASTSDYTTAGPHPCVLTMAKGKRKTALGVERGKMPVISTQRWKIMESVTLLDTFSDAFRKWIKNYSQHIQDRTRGDYMQYGAALSEFFSDCPLNLLDHRQIRAYQHWRSREGNEDPDEPQGLKNSKYRRAAGHMRIRNEINGVLKPILKEVGTWQEIKKHGFKHLPVLKGDGAGVALTKDEQSKILAVAFSEELWLTDAHILRIMYRTGSGFGEIRKLRKRDVDLTHGTIRIVHGAKNDLRVRTVALVPTALESMRWLVERWRSMGGSHPDDYLLPHRKRGFSAPMTSIYFAWRSIKKKTGEQHTEMRDKLERLRIYDCRVSAASLLLSNEKLSLPDIEKSLGWSPNSDMRGRYHRKELEDKRAALLTLEDEGSAA